MLDRREFLKKAGVASAMVVAAPVVVALPSKPTTWTQAEIFQHACSRGTVEVEGIDQFGEHCRVTYPLTEESLTVPILGGTFDTGIPGWGPLTLTAQTVTIGKPIDPHRRRVGVPGGAHGPAVSHRHRRACVRDE